MPGPRRARVGAVLGLCVTALVVGCARPNFQYAAESPGSTPAGTVYFKVPDGWTRFPPAQIAAAQRQWSTGTDAGSLLAATAWQAAYDSSERPSLDHVLGRAVPAQPVVYASLRSLYPEEQTGATTAALRELVVPVSALGAAVTVRSEADVTQGRATGVHQVVSYPPGQGLPEETIDQTSYLSDAKDAVYLLMVRCSTTCYDAHRAEIASVTSSFTIQEGRSG